MTIDINRLFQAELVKFKDMLIQQDSTSSINELPLNTVDEISMKNLKLEQVLDDQDRLLNEQSKLMKALNVRTKLFIFKAILIFLNQILH